MAIKPQKYTAKSGDITWRVRVDLGEDPATGKRQRPWVTRATEKACRQAAITLLEAHRTGRYRPPDGVSVAQFCDRYETYAAEFLAPATMISLRSAISCYIKPGLGRLRLQDVHESTVADWLEWLKDDAELSAATRNHARAKLHRIMAQAVEWRLIPHNPVTAVRGPKVTPRPPEFLDADQVVRLLAAVRGHLYEPFFLLGFATGMRRGELLGAVWSDLHLDAGAHGEIHVTEQLRRIGRGSFTRGELKTPTSKRIIPLPPGVAEQLRKFKTKDKAKRLQKPGWNPEGYIVVNTRGKHTWPNAIDLVLPRVLVQAGIERFTAHTMRHTYASLLEAAGTPRSEIQLLLGHANYGMTSHYTHGYRTKLGGAVAPLGGLFTRPPLGQGEGSQIFWPNGGLMEGSSLDDNSWTDSEKTAP